MGFAKHLLSIGALLWFSGCAPEVPEHKIAKCKPKSNSTGSNSSNSTASNSSNSQTTDDTIAQTTDETTTETTEEVSLKLVTSAFTENSCNLCHGDDGNGDTPLAASISDGTLTLAGFTTAVQEGVQDTAMQAYPDILEADIQSMYVALGGTADDSGSGSDTGDGDTDTSGDGADALPTGDETPNDSSNNSGLGDDPSATDSDDSTNTSSGASDC